MSEEILDEQKTEMPELKEVLSVIRRRRWLFLAPLFFGWLLVWIISWFLPTIYRSGTTIQVEQQGVPEQIVPTNINEDLQSRLDSITQQILSRTRLLSIIEAEGLYQGKGRELSADEKVDRMRKDIEIELNRAEDRKLSSFSISYSSSNPNVAQKTTGDLADLFVRENLEARQQQSENTTKFLEDQLEEARKNLAEQEARVREFKDRHQGELPSQLQTNLQIMSSLQTQLQTEQDALSRAQQQQTYLESLLAQYRSLEKSGKAGEAGSAGVVAIDRQIDALKTQLADLLSRYTEKHPDVRKLKLQIADLERSKQQLLAGGNPDEIAGTTASGDPREMAPKMELQSQLKANQVEIASRQRSIKDLQGQLGMYQARLNSSPGREQEFADITRDYNQSRTNYDSLLAKKNQSEMATNLEKTQQGERFRLLDPPNLPSRPYSPNRLKISAIGLFVGLLLGVGFASTAEYTDTRLHGERELKKLTSAPIIADVPPLLTPDEEAWQKRQDWVTMVAAGVVVSCMFVGFAITYLHG